MGNRIIKESHCTSERIAELSDFEFRLWVGLITQADDAGRGDARPAVIKGRVFALRDRVTVKDVSTALHILAAKGCVFLYEVDGKPYFWFPNWAAHQRVRDSKPKYPAPDEGTPLLPDADNLPQLAANCGELPPISNPIQSEYKSNPNTNPNTTRARAHDDAAANRRLENFESLWQTYPKQVAKRSALREFVMLDPSDELFQTMLAAVEAAKRSEEWQREGGRYIPKLANWIADRRWTDKVNLPAPTSSKGQNAVQVLREYQQRASFTALADELEQEAKYDG